jgi:hypothetical protein
MFKRLTSGVTTMLLLVGTILPTTTQQTLATTPFNQQVVHAEEYQQDLSLEFATHGYHPALSPDGKTVIVGKGRITNKVDNEYLLGMYNVKTGSLIKEIESHNSSDYYDYSPNGKYLISTGDYIIILDGSTGEELLRLPHYYAKKSFQANNDDLLALSFSSNNTLLNEDTVVIYDIKTNTKLFEKKYETQKTMKVAMHPSKPIVAVSYGLHVEIINYETGKTDKTIVNPFNLTEDRQFHAINFMQYSPDGHTLTVVSNWNVDVPLKQYSVTNQYKEGTSLNAYAAEAIKNRDALPKKLTYSPDGSEIYLYPIGKMKAYDAKTGQYKWTKSGDLNGIVFSNDMKTIAYTQNEYLNTGEFPKYVVVKSFPFVENKGKRIEFKDPYIQLRQGKSTYYGLEYVNENNQRVLLEPKQVKLEPLNPDVVEINASNKITAKSPGSTIVKASYAGLVDYLSVEVQSLSKSMIVVDTLYDSSYLITGKATANSTLFATSGNREYRVNTKADGTFRIDIDQDKPLKANTFVVFMLVSGDSPFGYEVYDYLYENVIRDTVAPNPPVVSTVDDVTGMIQGTTEPNATITVSLENMLAYSPTNVKNTVSVKTGRDGKFAFKLPFANMSGKRVRTVSKDRVGNQSRATVTSIKDRVAPTKPTVNPISNINTIVTGKTEANATITVYNGARLIGTGKAAGSGTFSVKIPKHAAGTILSVYATDASKNKSKATSIRVIKAPKIYSVSSITSRTDKVTGKTDPNSIVYLKKGSTIIGSVKANSKGGFTIRIPKQRTGQTVTVVAKNYGVLSQPLVVKVK